MNITKTEHIV